MKKEIEFNEVTDDTEVQSESVETLPSRRAKHPRPLSFLEKPTFSLIVFILFILFLGGIFFYFTSVKNNNESNKLNNSKESKENLLVNNNNNNAQATPPSDANQSDSISHSKTVPVVNTSNPDTENKPDEETIIEEQEEPLKFVTHHVVREDTLYGISKKYYGSATEEYMQKIMEANNLKDKNIRLNSNLIIPEPLLNP